jgi:hypothetical protein
MARVLVGVRLLLFFLPCMSTRGVCPAVVLTCRWPFVGKKRGGMGIARLGSNGKEDSGVRLTCGPATRVKGGVELTWCQLGQNHDGLRLRRSCVRFCESKVLEKKVLESREETQIRPNAREAN